MPVNDAAPAAPPPAPRPAPTSVRDTTVGDSADNANAGAPSLIVVSRTVAAKDRDAFDRWHGYGQGHIDAVLGGPGKAHTWHFPAAADKDGAGSADTIVMLFGNEKDRDTWWHSTERRAWVAAGEHLSPGGCNAAKVNLGSARGMGDWLPPRAGREALLALPPPPPPKWVVYANVLLAIYPTISVLGDFAFPALYAAAPAVKALPLAVKGFAQCATVVAVMTWAMIPLAAKITGALGFMDADTRNAASVAGVAAVAAAMVAVEHFALFPLLPAGGW